MFGITLFDRFLVDLTLVALCLADQKPWTVDSGTPSENAGGVSIAPVENMSAARNHVSRGKKTADVAAYFLSETIRRNKNDALSALDRLLDVPQNLLPNGDSTKSTCTPEQRVDASVLSSAMLNFLRAMVISKRNVLSDIYIAEVPNINGAQSDRTKISDLKLSNITVKGFENVMLLKYNLDLCEMSSDFEFKVPKLEISSLYTLNGDLNGYSIDGNGSLRMDIDWLYLNHGSEMNCDLFSASKNKCNMSDVKNDTSTIDVKNLKVNMTDINYQNKNLDKLLIDKLIGGELMNLISKGTEMAKKIIKILLNILFMWLPTDLVGFIKHILKLN